jgi:hypothetical protein
MRRILFLFLQGFRRKFLVHRTKDVLLEQPKGTHHCYKQGVLPRLTKSLGFSGKPLGLLKPSIDGIGLPPVYHSCDLHFIEMYCEMLCIVVISCMIGASFVGGMLDIVWEHGENVGTGFKCKYYRETKNGGCCTRLKEHLANSGKIVKKCISVHPDIKTYFQRDLDKTKNKKREMFRQ